MRRTTHPLHKHAANPASRALPPALRHYFTSGYRQPATGTWSGGSTGYGRWHTSAPPQAGSPRSSAAAAAMAAATSRSTPSAAGSVSPALPLKDQLQRPLLPLVSRLNSATGTPELAAISANPADKNRHANKQSVDTQCNKRARNLHTWRLGRTLHTAHLQLGRRLLMCRR